MQHGARRFAQRQQAAAKGAPLLADGLQATLEREVLAPLAPHAWPRFSAAVLQGLELPGRTLLPDRPCRPGGAAWSAPDPDSYLARLYAGPPQEPRLGTRKSAV